MSKSLEQTVLQELWWYYARKYVHWSCNLVLFIDQENGSLWVRIWTFCCGIMTLYSWYWSLSQASPQVEVSTNQLRSNWKTFLPKSCLRKDNVTFTTNTRLAQIWYERSRLRGSSGPPNLLPPRRRPLDRKGNNRGNLIYVIAHVAPILWLTITSTCSCPVRNKSLRP